MSPQCGLIVSASSRDAFYLDTRQNIPVLTPYLVDGAELARSQFYYSLLESH